MYQDRYIPNSAICFYVYHSVVSIYDDEHNLIYEYGGKRAEKGAMIGANFISANIPEKSWGKSLTFCTPIMLALFFFEQTKEDKVKKIQICLASGFTVFAGVCTILNYSTENYHYCRMISTFHILLLIGTILDFIIVIRYDMKNKLSSAVIKYGVLISLSIMFLEIVRYNIHRKTSSYISVLSRSFTSIAVVIFILALVVSYVVQLADHYISEYEKKILKI